ncbi:MAG: hypothetical protein K9M49_00275 [Candidatus Marinimicrobia bacterium]|nr:hypothetical protein [Candidatus Neomarinimicrobiota bacterium]MCF7903562.1 hypothetical protein [Candidatus Neomarinimicrobiota bacterium]
MRSTGRKLVIVAIMLGLLTAFTPAQGALQAYAKGKIMLKKGFILEGKSLQIFMDRASMEVRGVEQSYQLSEISQIMAKQGKAKKFGKYCGGSCAGFMLLTMINNPKATQMEDGVEIEYTPTVGEKVMTLALVGGVSYGGGYLAGQLSDEWQIVYFYNG